MNYIAITDIFGNKLDKDNEHNNFLPFILIHSTQPHLLIELVESDNDSIWKLIFPTIMHVLYTNKLNPARFSPVGHIWLPISKLPNKITLLLVNTDHNISRYPIDYVHVNVYESVNIWKPIAPTNFKPIGYIASKEKPPLNMLRVINNDLVTVFRGDEEVVGNNINMNEFQLLCVVGNNRYTIKRSTLLKNNNTIKLYSNSEKNYVSEDKDRSVSLKNYSPNKNDKINYTAQGELKLNGRCIGISMDENIRDSFVYLQKCNDSDKQKWYPYQDHFISQFDQSCLTSEIDSDTVNDNDVNDDIDPIFKQNKNNHLKVQQCAPIKEQSWRIDNIDEVIEDQLQETTDTSKWRTIKGKKVILIEPEEPWYINRGNKKPIGITKENVTELNKVEYRDHADFHSNFMMDTNKPDLGYGYSYADRAGASCHCLDDCDKSSHNTNVPVLEHFDHNNNKINNKYNLNIIPCSLLFIVILLVLIRIYKNKK